MGNAVDAFVTFHCMAQAVSEMQLLEALLLWAGRTASSPAASDPRPLYIVEALMHLVRFPLMADAELQVHDKHTGQHAACPRVWQVRMGAETMDLCLVAVAQSTCSAQDGALSMLPP